MDFAGLERAGHALMGAIVAGLPWKEPLEEIMPVLGCFGGGLARVTLPDLFGLPSSGLAEVVDAIDARKAPPVSKLTRVGPAPQEGFVCDQMDVYRLARERDPFCRDFVRRSLGDPSGAAASGAAASGARPILVDVMAVRSSRDADRVTGGCPHVPPQPVWIRARDRRVVNPKPTSKSTAHSSMRSGGFEAVKSAGAVGIRGSPPATRPGNQERAAQRDGHRHRAFTRLGTPDLAVPPGFRKGRTSLAAPRAVPHDRATLRQARDRWR